MHRPRNQFTEILMIGAAGRLAIAILISAAIWLGYFWATTSPGGL